MSIDVLMRLARSQANRPSGLTVSGGEPTDQAEAVATLIEGFRRDFPTAEVILYSGLRWSVLEANHMPLISLLDVVVAGPYVRTLEATALSGSNNQEVRLLTPLAERLYRGWNNWPRHALQIGHKPGDQVVMVGIPNIARIAQAAKKVNAIDGTWDHHLPENRERRQ